MMEQSPRRREECFAENQGSDGCHPNKSMTIIECLGASADRSSVKALKIPRLFTIAIQPFDKVRYAKNLVRERDGVADVRQCKLACVEREVVSSSIARQAEDRFEFFI
jgi:hypothetical protein